MSMTTVPSEPTTEGPGWAEMTDREMLAYAWTILSKVEREMPHTSVVWAEVATAVGHLRRRIDRD
jgi:hypothetical protein